MTKSSMSFSSGAASSRADEVVYGKSSRWNARTGASASAAASRQPPRAVDIITAVRRGSAPLQRFNEVDHWYCPRPASKTSMGKRSPQGGHAPGQPEPKISPSSKPCWVRIPSRARQVEVVEELGIVARQNVDPAVSSRSRPVGGMASDVEAHPSPPAPAHGWSRTSRQPCLELLLVT